MVCGGRAHVAQKLLVEPFERITECLDERLLVTGDLAEAGMSFFLAI